MTNINKFDVIIVGGSYSGLAAGMALGRALRKVLIIDSGRPCNIQTPHSHNFITQDGKTPQEISAAAKLQVEQYDTVKFYKGLAVSATKTATGFEIRTGTAELFSAKKLVFATGVKDLLPDIAGFSECWGISAIHCPYCHGYEVRNEKTGIIGNGDYGFDFSKLISNWTKDLTLFTNGKSSLTSEQGEKIKKHNIRIIETEIEKLEHTNGYVRYIILKDGSKHEVKAVYSRPPFIQHCDLPEKLGCAFTEAGHIQTDGMQKTTIPGVFACGDNVTPMRSVANAVAMGTFCGAALNKELIDEEF